MKHTLPATEYKERFANTVGRYGVNTVHRNALHHLDPQPGEKILDIGCGEGELVGLLVESGAEVTGVDYVQETLDTAQKHVPKGTFMKGDMRALSFADALFDKAVALGVVGYVAPDELPKAFREAHRVLRPGGMLIIRTSPPLTSIGHWILSRAVPGYRSEAARYSRRYLARTLRTAGFAGVRGWLALDRSPVGSWRDIAIIMLYPFFAQQWICALRT